MKNFPHQVNDLDKLRSALSVVAELIEDEADVSDDSEVGQALTRKGVYTYRDKKLSIKSFLKKENLKPRASRGTEAAARDIRRFFVLTKLIKPSNGAAKFSLSKRGKRLLDTEDAAKQKTVWRQALLDMALSGEEDEVSHPYRILLRLVDDVPGIETAKLMLALEAEDDSQEEYDRVLNLAKRSFTKIKGEIKVSDASARNAVKILPAIARQLGDISSSKGKTYGGLKPVVTEEGIAVPAGPAVSVVAVEPVLPDALGKDPDFGESGNSVFDLAAAIATRKKRTLQHQKGVRSLGKLMQGHGFDLYKSPYDCLAFSAQHGRGLFELKTLDGSPVDERQQAERALGQLYSYDYFNIPPALQHEKAHLVVAFTQRPSQKTVDFLVHNNVKTIWLEQDVWRTGSVDDSGEFSPLIFGVD